MNLLRLSCSIGALAGLLLTLPVQAQSPAVDSSVMERSAVVRSKEPFLCERNLVKNGRMDQGVVVVGNGSLDNGSSLAD